MGTSSVTRVAACCSSRVTGSIRWAPGWKSAWLERGTSCLAAFPRATRSSTVRWGTTWPCSYRMPSGSGRDSPSSSARFTSESNHTYEFDAAWSSAQPAPPATRLPEAGPRRATAWSRCWKQAHWSRAATVVLRLALRRAELEVVSRDDQLFRGFVQAVASRPEVVSDSCQDDPG